MFEGFPYTNFHELNLDWIIKIAKDFLDQYTNIQQTITDGLEDLDEKAQQLQAALDAWYEEHSEDIDQQLTQAMEDLNDWYTEHQNYLDETLSQNIIAFNNAADAKAALTIASIPDDYTELATTVANLESAFTNTVGTVIFSGTNHYNGIGPENWSTIELSGAMSLYICFPDNPGKSIEVNAYTDRWNLLDTITDTEWHKIEIPAGATNDLMFTYRGSDAFDISASIVNNATNNIIDKIIDIPELQNDVEELQDIVNGTENYYGCDPLEETRFRSNMLGYSVCPCKKLSVAGKLKSLFVRSYVAGNTVVQVGKVDQLYLFVPRTSFNVTLAPGEQTIDVSDLDIYMAEEEQLLIRFIDRTPFNNITGSPEGDTSFYYSPTGGNQLQVFGAQQAAVFGFGYTVATSINDRQEIQIQINTNNIDTMQGTISDLQASQNIVSDDSGNKYRIIVVNGALALKSLNYSRVLCVGNSYTIHPIITDVEPDYANQIWWGHWAMAASKKENAWPSLVENALKTRNPSAVVTPIFGRRYETNYNTYTLDNPNTFQYWNGSAWQSLKDNLASFTDVDAVIFFLGANYSGSDWYSLYKPMIEKFKTWFPGIDVYGCSTSSRYNAAKDSAIEQALTEEAGVFINLVGINANAQIGAYVSGDDNLLHQINNNAVANHFGDYGEYLITDRVCNAIGYNNPNAVYNVNINSPATATLTVVSDKALSGNIVTVFADVAAGETLADITVMDENSQYITVTDHGVTDYGRVFTFTMPASHVTIS